MANEGPIYHETRRPYFQSGNFTAISPLTTSISMVPILRVPFTSLAFPAGYWLESGKRWMIRMGGVFTTAATPGNWTFEIRHQTGTPTDAGGTILATSAATAFTASKTNITFRAEFWIEGRGDASTFVPTATPLWALGQVAADGTGAVITAPGNPIMIPATLGGTATNVDGTLAGTIHIDVKRSGSTAESVTVTDLSVNAMT